MSNVEDARSARLDLDTVRKARAVVADAMVALEDALASPAGAGDEFVAGVTAALDHLVGVGVEQMDSFEDTGGLLDDIVLTAPRLSGHVDKVRDQRTTLRDLLTALQAAAAAATSGTGSSEELRDSGLRLLGEVARYRQRVGDLVYEAYYVDLGGPG